MRFAIGDRVFIRDDLDITKQYSMEDTPDRSIGINSSMVALGGSETTIIGIEDLRTEKWYRLDIDKGNWCWSDEMFSYDLPPIEESDVSLLDFFGIGVAT